MKRGKQRGHGEGAIWYDAKSGKYLGQISLGGSGKFRVRKTLRRKTKQELVDALARARTQQVDGLLPTPSTVTVKEYLTHWLSVRGPELAASSVRDYELLFGKHITPLIGSRKMQALSQLEVEGTIAKIASTNARRKTLTVFRQALAAAIPSVIAVNPARGIVKPKINAKEIHPLNLEQARAFIKHIEGDAFEPLYLLALGTGARVGELLALQWEDVDLPGKSLSIRRTLTLLRGELVCAAPKTRGSRRKILLTADCMRGLHTQQAARMRGGLAGQPWVFCTRRGKLYRSGVILRKFQRALNAAGLPKIRFHDLRHTMATLLLLAGEHPKVVSERLGHAKVSITLDIYSHILPTMQEQAVEKLDRMFA